MSAAINVIDLCKTYKLGSLEVEVLKNITVTIEKGDFISIMGPSGSGKSTFLYLTGGLDKPTSGSIFISGKDISLMKDRDESLMRRRDIGFVFQFYNLIPNLNVEENILLPVLIDGKKYMDFKVRLAEIIEIVGLTERKHHTPRELSGGEQQRTALARALINKPDIILADEPTGNLDTKSGTEILKLLRKINDENGHTIVMVTHSNDAASFSNRTISMKDGRIK
jgi:putative ABC transport system ATP-binding protein